MAFIFAVTATLIALIATRSRKQLSNDSSPERKLINKTVGLIMCITYYLLFMPVSTFNSRFLTCQDREYTCYKGDHLIVFCFVVLTFGLHILLILYSSSMLTTCYPHENIPWAHFPSSIPFFKLAVRFPIVLAY